MAFFKFRKGEGASVAKPAKSESVEAMRRRARQRLIGAAVLVLAGVIGFPLLFDTQPRPVALDIPIEIPDRQKSGVLTAPAPEAAAPVAAAEPAQQPKAPAPVTASAVVAAVPASAGDAADAGAAPAARVEAKPESRPQAKPAPSAQPKPEARVAAGADSDGARARALLEGRLASSAPASAVADAGKPADAAGDRFVVQVGAFAEAAKAREVRLRLERAGVKTYVHVAETKEGTRIRVRAGPFTSRADADKAAQKIKGLDLPAAVLTL